VNNRVKGLEASRGWRWREGNGGREANAELAFAKATAWQAEDRRQRTEDGMSRELATASSPCGEQGAGSGELAPR
jgi:hypothetical protein